MMHLYHATLNLDLPRGTQRQAHLMNECITYKLTTSLLSKPRMVHCSFLRTSKTGSFSNITKIYKNKTLPSDVAQVNKPGGIGGDANARGWFLKAWPLMTSHCISFMTHSCFLWSIDASHVFCWSLSSHHQDSSSGWFGSKLIPGPIGLPSTRNLWSQFSSAYPPQPASSLGDTNKYIDLTQKLR